GWYLEEVRRQLVAQYGDTAVETSGMTVEVAMDPRLQAAAEQAVREGLRAVDKRQGWRGAPIRLDATRVDDVRSAITRRYTQRARRARRRRRGARARAAVLGHPRRSQPPAGHPARPGAGADPRSARRFHRHGSAHSAGGGDGGRVRRGPQLVQPRHPGAAAAG